jgi:3-hydroxyacyl-[acyl-carrier-protein] dehydratase
MNLVLGQLPHRFPFLFVDRVLEREPSLRVVAEKLVSMSEPYLQGHLPGRPLVPGVLMLEMLAQTAAFLHEDSLGEVPVFLAQVVDARFKAPAYPGDRLRLEVRTDAAFGSLQRIDGTVTCEGRVLCTAKLLLKMGAPMELAPKVRRAGGEP